MNVTRGQGGKLGLSSDGGSKQEADCDTLYKCQRRIRVEYL